MKYFSADKIKFKLQIWVVLNKIVCEETSTEYIQTAEN